MDELQVGYKHGDLTLMKIKNDMGHNVYHFKCKCKKYVVLYESELNKLKGNCGKCKQSHLRPIHGRPEMQTEQYKQWRKSVMARYGWKCFCCGSKKGIQAHHLNNWQAYPHLRYEINNGVCLCSTKPGQLNEFGNKGCHDLFHDYFGKNHTTKEQFALFAFRFFRKDFK